jgi:hypothetical protein
VRGGGCGAGEIARGAPAAWQREAGPCTEGEAELRGGAGGAHIAEDGGLLVGFVRGRQLLACGVFARKTTTCLRGLRAEDGGLFAGFAGGWGGVCHA